jgi:gliding motility-associated-like protein
MAISKFIPDGTTLEYSTYIGGISADVPHSMVVNSLGQLVILGSTSSPDYPTIESSYDTTFNGGTTINYTSNGTNFENGSDIIITVLSADGSSLVGSTFLGGTLNDGLNEDAALTYNYGDIFRGEVIVDASDNIYIASSTESADFPTTTGALDETLGGTQDACLAKFNSDVSVLEWCTFVGGSSGDAGYSLKLNSINEIYITGGTASSNLAVDPSALFPSYGGGTADGYLFRISNDGNSIVNSTYIGTSAYDQSYFVEVDDDDDVYLYGQSVGSYPVTTGTYFNLNGRQFIQKMSTDLTSSLFSTVFGSGGANVNISPTAFLVDVCERVFISGWGGATNNSWNAVTGNTNGLAVTSDAEQTITDGSDFYFMVLEEDATALLYGSYFGGNGINEHVDGGTSRFNDNGVIHQAACAGCGGSNDFPTTPDVVSNVNGNSCNLGVVKLDLEISAVEVDIIGGGAQNGCAPFEVDFESDLVNATDFVWYFGDGDSSHVENPSHIYNNPGEYEVWLIGTDTAFCTGETFTDTSITIITVNLLTDAAEAGNGGHLCPGDSIQIGADAIAGYTYQWDPPLELSNPTGSNPYASPNEDTEYFLTILNDDNCEDSDSVLITVFGIEAFPDTIICTNDSIQMSVIGGSSFSWSPAAGVSDPSSPNPYITAGFSNTYTVTADDGLGCEDTAVVNIGSLAGPTALFDVEIDQSCLGDSVQFINLSDGADGYEWNIGGIVTNEEEPIILFEPGDGPIVYLIASNNDGECIDTLAIDYMNGWYSEDSVTVTYPNVFTPDGDGINDCFAPDFTGDLDDCFTLKIFNRWGRLLYDTEKYGGDCWDGTQRTDDLVSKGTYYYIANVRGMDHAGFVTVLY